MVKLLIHFETLAVQPLKFGKGKVVLSHTLLGACAHRVALAILCGGQAVPAESCTHPAKRDNWFPPPIAERQRLLNVRIASCAVSQFRTRSQGSQGNSATHYCAECPNHSAQQLANSGQEWFSTRLPIPATSIKCGMKWLIYSQTCMAKQYHPTLYWVCDWCCD